MKPARCSRSKICCHRPDAGPEALYVRSVLLDELELALDELPDEQREVFVLTNWRGAASRSYLQKAA